MLEIVSLAKSCIGMKESDGSFKTIIDTYNSYKPLPQGYKMKYTDAWCATFISYLAIKCGLTDIIPVECGCERQINLFKKLGEWEENDAYVPKEGDIIYYDWQDNGKGNNTGWSDHVGIVEACDGKTITVIEGNKSDSVSRRCISVNGKYIRGFAIPKYTTNVSTGTQTVTITEVKKVNIALTQLSQGSKGAEVKTAQILLNKKLSPSPNLAVDGAFGKLTKNAVYRYQKATGITPLDSIIGIKTWTQLLTK